MDSSVLVRNTDQPLAFFHLNSGPANVHYLKHPGQEALRKEGESTRFHSKRQEKCVQNYVTTSRMQTDLVSFYVTDSRNGMIAHQISWSDPFPSHRTLQNSARIHQSLNAFLKDKSLKLFLKMSHTRLPTLIAAWLRVGLEPHTQGNSGQVQEEGWIIGWLLWVGCRWAWAAPLEEDPQNELLHQKLRLATSVNIWVIFQMSISWSQWKPWCCCYHKQLGWKRTQNTFLPIFGMHK